MKREELFKSDIVKKLHSENEKLRLGGAKEIKLEYKDSKNNMIQVKVPRGTSEVNRF